MDGEIPGSEKDLLSVKAEGGDVRIVYSPLDAVKIAKENPCKKIVFFAVGFETTAPANALSVSEAMRQGLKNYFLLTSKPVLYAANISEDDLMSGNTENDFVKKVKGFAAKEASEVIVVCARLEEELSSLEDDEKVELLEEYGLEESGLDKLIHASYKLLGLISFLTAGSDEVRAWTIEKGTKAPQAAGKIHTDIERGFIRAEIISYDKLVECGSESAAKEK